MALVTIRKCDRCKREMRDKENYVTVEHRSQKKELCDMCTGKFDKFMNGMDPSAPDYDLAKPTPSGASAPFGRKFGDWVDRACSPCYVGSQKFSAPPLFIRDLAP